MSAKDLKVTVLRIIAALNEGHLEVLDAYYAVDLTCHRPPYPDIKDLDSYKQWGTEFRKAFPDMRSTIDEIIAEGDTVAARLTYQGTHTAPLGRIPPTGKQVKGPGCIVYHWRDGKIVREWDHWDELGFWRQLGYKLVPSKE